MAASLKGARFHTFWRHAADLHASDGGYCTLFLRERDDHDFCSGVPPIRRTPRSPPLPSSISTKRARSAPQPIASSDRHRRHRVSTGIFMPLARWVRPPDASVARWPRIPGVQQVVAHVSRSFGPPGPLTTSRCKPKLAMLRDWGSWDAQSSTPSQPASPQSLLRDRIHGDEFTIVVRNCWRQMALSV